MPKHVSLMRLDLKLHRIIGMLFTWHRQRWLKWPETLPCVPLRLSASDWSRSPTLAVGCWMDSQELRERRVFGGYTQGWARSC